MHGNSNYPGVKPFLAICHKTSKFQESKVQDRIPDDKDSEINKTENMESFGPAGTANHFAVKLDIQRSRLQVCIRCTEPI